MKVDKTKRQAELKDFLDSKVDQYNRPGFIENDPISIPHRFTKKQDIEIAGLFASVLAWGQRLTIIRNCQELMKHMDQSPHEFILHHSPRDLKKLESFKHRTYNSTDLLYFIEFLRSYYRKYQSMEDLFLVHQDDDTIEKGLINFHHQFFSLADFPARTRKHIATPERKSACKRLNMYLRWMVRRDQKGVDFGIWNKIPTRQLVCPVDLHVERVARKLKLMKNKPLNWQAAVDLTKQLRQFDPIDPVKYDFALFGLGIEEKF